MTSSQEWLAICHAERYYAFSFWMPYRFDDGWGSIVFSSTNNSNRLQWYCDSQLEAGRIPEVLPWYEFELHGLCSVTVYMSEVRKTHRGIFFGGGG